MTETISPLVFLHTSEFWLRVFDLENSVLQGHYAESGGNFLPTFRDNYHYSLRNNPEERSPQLPGGGILKSLQLALIASSFG